MTCKCQSTILSTSSSPSLPHYLISFVTMSSLSRNPGTASALGTPFFLNAARDADAGETDFCSNCFDDSREFGFSFSSKLAPFETPKPRRDDDANPLPGPEPLRTDNPVDIADPIDLVSDVGVPLPGSRPTRARKESTARAFSAAASRRSVFSRCCSIRYWMWCSRRSGSDYRR